MSRAAAADLLFRPVDELASMVRSGEVSSRELVQASLDRIEEVEPKVNAFVDVFAEEALAAADAIGPGDERPLAGVPIAIKNNVPMAGKRLTFCSPFMGDFEAPYDHNVVTRLRDQAGCVIVGTTTLPEWGIQPVTETRRFGATRNPWALDRTPGGSSGGSAAAVASGMVPLAHGNDGGGSTRIPAACCGLVGLKAARGRVSMAPAAGEQFLSIDGVLTRTVAETALALDILSGPELGDASWAPPPGEPYAAAAAREPRGLRIGLMLAPPLPDVPLDADYERATREAAALFEELGHNVEEIDPPFRETAVMAPFTAVFGPMNCSLIAIASMMTGRTPSVDDTERLSMWLWETCQQISSVDGYLATLQLQGVARQWVQHTAPYDAVLTPGLAQPPLKIGTLDPDREDSHQVFREAGKFTPFTAIANITGQPAINLPLGRRDDGLPLGAHLIGRPTDEATLLALGAQAEAARPWIDRRAPIA
jgi:amidase